MKTTTKWADGLQFNMTNAIGTEMIMDARKEIGGGEKGVTPMEAILGGLAGCMGMDVVTILRPQKDKIQLLEFETDGNQNQEKPNFFTDIHTTVRVEGDIKADRIWRAVRLSDEKYCSVANSLKANLTYSVILNGEEVEDEKK